MCGYLRAIGSAILLLLLEASSPDEAMASRLRFHQGVGGSVRTVTVQQEESLIEMARRHHLGFNEIAAANPGVDAFIPSPGTPVTIPGSWILPDAPLDADVVVNLSDMRLYRFPNRDRSTVESFPIGIGDQGWDTPTGRYRIVEKIRHPAWHVPADIRGQRPWLPKVVPPGPRNPLGEYALRLSHGAVLIHGTDRPFGIGRRVSHGCIHLYPEDIAALFGELKLGSRVSIVRQPVKATLYHGRVLLSVHPDRQGELAAFALAVLERKGLTARVDGNKLRQALEAPSGLPTDVTLTVEAK